jgi:hypothetical protein
MCSRMRSVTKWSDILALTCWVNLRSPWGWVVSVVVAAAITADVMGPRLVSEGESLPKSIALSFFLFMTIMTAIWFIGLVGMLLMASANLLRKGAVGAKSFAISADALTEDDGDRTTAVSWRQVRSIDKTRRHIFIRISRWKYIQLSARDFQNEHQFAQYYADLVKAKLENT